MNELPVLGWTPTRAELVVSKNADLTFTLPAKTPTGSDTTWPNTTAATLTIYDKQAGNSLLTRALVVTTNTIECIIESTDITPIIGTAKWFGIYVALPGSSTKDFLLYYGSVTRKD